jgi:hypothetical protein
VSSLCLWLPFQEQSRRSSSEKNQPPPPQEEKEVSVETKEEQFSGFLAERENPVAWRFLMRDMYIGSMTKSFKDSIKVLEADLQHANTL